jgi:transposase
MLPEKRKKHHELTTSQRGEILGMRKAGMGYGAIAKEMHISKSTVVSVIKRFQGRTDLSSKKRCGRPSKVTKKMMHRLDTYIKRHRDHTPKEIVAKLHLPVKERRVYDLRKKLGFIADKGKKVPNLTEQQKEMRVRWCKKYKNNGFSDTIWADEKPLEFGKSRRFMYRKFKEPRITKPNSKHPKKITLYAAISREGKSQITLWEGRQNPLNILIHFQKI